MREVVYYVSLAHDRDMWHSVVDRVRKVRVPETKEYVSGPTNVARCVLGSAR
jgi:hypothetical protein